MLAESVDRRRSGLLVSPLGERDLDAFSCDSEALDEWVRQQFREALSYRSGVEPTGRR